MQGFRRTVAEIRGVGGLMAVLALADAFEAWIRIGLLPWHRRDTAAWHRRWNRIARAWGVGTARIARISLGLKIEVQGEIPDDGRYLVVSNHQSSLDIPLLIHMLRPLNLKFVAHRGLEFGKPFVSVCLRNGGFAVVHKTNAFQDFLRLRTFAAKLEATRGSPMIFPEGIRTFDGTIGPFDIAGMRLLQERSGLPVLPVVHDGLWTARTVGEVHRLVGTTLRFRVLAPVPPERFTADPERTYREIERSLRDGLAALRGEEAILPARRAARV